MLANAKGMLAAPLSRYLLALQHPDYRTLWTANMCAGAAAWALIVARGWLAYEITDGSSTLAGIVTFAAMIPRLFSTPLMGFLADRLDRQTMLSWTYTFNLVHNIALAVLVSLGVVQNLDGPWFAAAGPWILIGLSALNGTLRSAQMTTTQSLVPNLVPREHLLNAVSLNEATQQGSRLVGPVLIAPLLLGTLSVAGYAIGIEAAFWLCAALYGLGLIQVTRIGTRSTGRMDPNQGFLGNLVAGFSYVYSRPMVLAMVLLVLAHCSLVMSYESLLPAISDDKLNAGPQGVSYLLGAVGAGALITAVFLAGIRSESTRGWLFLIFGVTSGIGPILLAVSTNIPLSLAAAVAMGVNQGGFMTISHAIIQSIVDDSVRGRVSGVYSVHVGGSMALANLFNGVFADVIDGWLNLEWVLGGASIVLSVGGVMLIIAVLSSLGSSPLRRLYFPPKVATPAAVA
jgi:MFS family permease